MNRLVTNTSWIVGGKIVQNLLGFVVSMLSARYLGPSNYGLINYAVSVVTFISPFALLGLNSILVREIVTSPEDEGKILGTSMVMSFTTSLLGVFTAACFAFIFNAGEKETIIVVVLYSMILLSQALELIQYWFQAKLLSSYSAVIALISYVIVAAYKVYLLITQKSVYWFAVSYALDSLIIAVLLMLCYRKLGGKRLSFSVSQAKDLFQKSKYFILPELMISFCVQTDKIMLKGMMDDTVTGFYSAATVCVGLTSFLFSAIGESFRPVIFQSKKRSTEDYERNMVWLYCIFIYLSAFQAIGYMVFAKPLVMLTYGMDYLPAVPMVRILSWYTAFSCIGIARNIWIIAEEKQKYLFVINLTGAVTNIIGNCILIPAFGGEGAAIASLLTQFVMNIIVGMILKPLRGANRLMLRAVRPCNLLEIWNKLKRTDFE